MQLLQTRSSAHNKCNADVWALYYYYVDQLQYYNPIEIKMCTERLMKRIAINLDSSLEFSSGLNSAA